MQHLKDRRRCKPVLIPLSVLCSLGACNGYYTAEVKPGERNYPTLNPHPTDVIEIRALIPPTLKVEFQYGYAASPTAGGVMGSGTECQHEVGLAVTEPFYVDALLTMAADGASYRGAVTVDKFQPGHCLWGFTGLTARSVYPLSLQSMVVRFRDDAPSPREVAVDVWCVRGDSSAPELCGDLSFLSMKGYVTAGALAAIAPSQRSDSQVTIGPNTQIIDVTFHDLGYHPG
jgi:hypothetical protein